MADKRDPVRLAGESTDTVNGIAGDLDGLAAAFEITGNDSMATDLHGVASKLREASRQFMDAIAIQVRERTADAEQASRNMLQAALIHTGLIDKETQS